MSEAIGCASGAREGGEVNEPDQLYLFMEEEIVSWKAEWKNMPEYSNEDLAPKFQVVINFACAGDVEDFGKLIGQPINLANGTGKQMRSFWFPQQEIGRMVNKRYIEVSA